MKTSLAVHKLKYFFTLLVFSFMSTVLWAQQETTESSSSTTKVNITEESSADWYTNPIVWIVGGAIFILLLVALLRSGGSDKTATHTDRVTYKEKVVRENDTDRDAI